MIQRKHPLTVTANSPDQHRPKVHLFTQIYASRDKDRLERLIQCLEHNLAVDAVSKITVLSEGVPITSENERINVKKIYSRASFADFFHTINEESDSDATHVAIANGDIMLSSDISILLSRITLDSTVAALTRHELDGRLKLKPFESQDTWIFKKHSFHCRVTDRSHIPLGIAGCEHLLAATLYFNGYNIWNPSLDCKTIHNDPSPSNAYTDRLYGCYLLLPACKVVDVESEQPAYQFMHRRTTSFIGSMAKAQAINSPPLNERPERQLFATHIKRLGLTRVLDIGSNTGQFVSKLRGLGYNGMIYSVEPQIQCRGELLAKARDDARWIILPRQGVGARRGIAELNISNNSHSSSFLPVHTNHINAEPGVLAVSRETVFINRTADLMNPMLMDLIDAVKIDVQGFEREVLKGLLPHLEHIQLLMVELSIMECYVSGPTLIELDSWITGELGFERISLEPSYYNENQLMAQQYDGLYRRRAKTTLAHPLGIKLDAIVTSAAGTLQRINAAGDDIGSEWFQMCLNSWKLYAPKIVSIAEKPPSTPLLKWIPTQQRPTISDMFCEIESLSDRHVLLTNADILLANSIAELCSAVDPGVVYYGNRTDIIQTQQGQFANKGLYRWGFDYFVLPPCFVRAVNSEGAFPLAFRIGEPWWDYFLPVLALAKGYPTKRLEAPHAFHHFHRNQYSEERWLENGDQFLACISALRAQGSSVIDGLLDELLAVKDCPDPKLRLHTLSRLVTSIVP